MEGVVHIEFLDQGQAVDSENSNSDVFGGIRTQSCNTTMRTRTSRQTQDALRQLELTTLLHLAYSPNLAPFVSPTQEKPGGQSL
ncbi:hypothetical protein ElyMa_004769600 [Elysia marginata]|uniref:Uncharacterized protein n=1 Tax=Elysia marginata TaxID=1093978 RepID=A0AAV4IF75_9GAST|nr:hypothetical protein ElyMa_004769600 [Elysia marginata]